ncbi:ISAs1 family transposase [Streptomyces sp. NPDC088350]|uniref:ISAs1 family transposase n=1 Tax=Streptomyces sp. NPDC088350 TaxID=3365854 RepID=UPI00380AFB26
MPARSPRSRNGSATSLRGPAGFSASHRPALRHRVRPAPSYPCAVCSFSSTATPWTERSAFLTARVTPADPGLRAIAVAGKALRGSRTHVTGHVTLLAAMDRTGHVLAQRRVTDKSNEIPAFRPLLDSVDLTGAVITADALHTQHAHGTYLRERGAHCMPRVKANHPSLFDRVRRLPWREIRLDNYDRTRAHHRLEIRRLKAAAFVHLGYPDARLALHVVRRRKDFTSGKLTIERVHLITNLPPGAVTGAQLAAWIRGHWTIENLLHHARDWRRPLAALGLTG